MGVLGWLARYSIYSGCLAAPGPFAVHPRATRAALAQPVGARGKRQEEPEASCPRPGVVLPSGYRHHPELLGRGQPQPPVPPLQAVVDDRVAGSLLLIFFEPLKRTQAMPDKGSNRRRREQTED
jgi:hypothetical protein